jgi:hypothetical protein
MSKEAKSVSAEQDVGETRTYAEIAQALAAGSTEEQEETPTPGANADEIETETEEETVSEETTESTESTSQPENQEPQTLEEARELLNKFRKERDNAQSKIGSQGNELGDLRKEVAQLRAEMAAKPPEKKPAEEEESKSYSELFKADERFKGMTPESKEYMGRMFDLFEERLLKRVTKAPEIEQIRTTVSSQEMQRTQARWEKEANDLVSVYGKELVEKHGKAVSDGIVAAVNRGMAADEISVTKLFRELAFDDILNHVKQDKGKSDAEVKDELNARAKKRGSRTGAKTVSTLDVSNLSGKEAFQKLLEEDRKRGLVP